MLGLLLGVRKLALGDSKQTVTIWPGEHGDRGGVTHGAQGRHWGVLRTIVPGYRLRIACTLLGEQCARLGEQNEPRHGGVRKPGVCGSVAPGDLSQVGFGWWRTPET